MEPVRRPATQGRSRTDELALPRGARRAERAMSLPPGVEPAELLLDKQRAFDVFLQTVRQPESFEENKLLLKQSIEQAKLIGEQANKVRAAINAAKTRLERLRNERAMTAVGIDDGQPLEDGPEELAELREIESLKGEYRDRTAQLRQVKGDVERIQRLLEQNKVRMQREFEAWFAELRRQTSLEELPEERRRELYAQIVGKSVPASSSDAAP